MEMNSAMNSTLYSTMDPTINSTVIGYGYKNETLNEYENETLGEYEYDLDEEQNLFMYIMKLYSKYFASMWIYLFVIVIIFGVIGNVINIIVMTRKDMVNPINAILTSLAFADMVMLVSYILRIPTSLYSLCNNLIFCCSNSYLDVVIALISVHVYTVSQAVSAWLTVLVAAWRVMTLWNHTSSITYHTLSRVITCIVLTYAVCLLSYTTKYMTFRIGPVNDTECEYWWLELSDIYINNYYMFDLINFLGLDGITQIVPCILLPVMTIILIRIIHKANKNRLKRYFRTDPDRNRTTQILIVILIIFLLTKLPQGIVHTLYHTIVFYDLDFKYAEKMIKYLEISFDFFNLFNSAINFAVYCSMSSQYRATFLAIFIKPVKKSKFVMSRMSVREQNKSQKKSINYNKK